VIDHGEIIAQGTTDELLDRPGLRVRATGVTTDTLALLAARTPGSGTAARPVTRGQVLVARYLGYASVLAVYALVLSGSLLLMTRVFTGYAPPHPVHALLLLLGQGLILLGLVALGTSFLPPVANGIGVLMLFGVAFIGGIVSQIGRLVQNGTAAAIGDGVRYVTPTDAYFRMALERLAPRSSGLAGEFLSGPFGMPSGIEAGMVLYGVFFLLVCLTASVLLFKRRDL